MKQNVNAPVAIAVVVIVAIVICGALYWKFFHTEVYTPQDIAAKFHSAPAPNAPPNQRPK